VDRERLKGQFERLAGLRGDPAKGLPVTAWAEALVDVDHEALLRAAIRAVRELVLQEWIDRRKTDDRPEKAIEAAERWLREHSPEAQADAKAAAKACTAAKNETFGDGHRVPQAARHLAWSLTPDETAGLHECLANIEEELLSRIALMGEYHLGPAQRRAILDVLRAELLPVEAPVVTSKEPDPAELPPAPYSPDSTFKVGQRISHKKFGEVVAVAAAEGWVEVQLADGTKKRLAHKPA
jgi:hypothetical protein